MQSGAWLLRKSKRNNSRSATRWCCRADIEEEERKNAPRRISLRRRAHVTGSDIGVALHGDTHVAYRPIALVRILRNTF